MKKEDFCNQLTSASSAALRFGQQYVSNCLSQNVIYVVALNQSHDGNRKEDEIIYPEDDGKIYSGLSQIEVVELLYREERCPEWINIRVAGADRDVTLVSLECCGRYHCDESKLYYTWNGTQPFGIKSPILPHDWKEGEKFELRSPSKAIEEIIVRNSWIFKDAVKVFEALE